MSRRLFVTSQTFVNVLEFEGKDLILQCFEFELISQKKNGETIQLLPVL
jgi:hypothetical protein